MDGDITKPRRRLFHADKWVDGAWDGKIDVLRRQHHIHDLKMLGDLSFRMQKLVSDRYGEWEHGCERSLDTEKSTHYD